MLPLRPAAAAVAFAFALAAAPRPAAAQPVSFRLQNDVPAGHKPLLHLVGAERVSDILLAVDRDDGAHFEARHGGLRRGQKVTLAIGDGKAGRYHYSGKLSLTTSSGDPWAYDIAFDTVVRADLTLRYDAEHLDLPGKVLRFQMSRPAGKASVVVLAEDGSELGRGEAEYAREPPGTWLALPWTQDKAARVLMIKLRAAAADGLEAAVDLVPWSVDVEHQEVNFDTDSAVIRPGEAGKLDASYAKIVELARYAQRFIPVKLYVAGHTDTVGTPAHNRQLSLDRARAIAEYLRHKGLTMAIAYEGFGEEVPRVATPDGTDEPRNRRVDYVLGAAAMPPPFRGPYTAVPSAWKAVR